MSEVFRFRPGAPPRSIHALYLRVAGEHAEAHLRAMCNGHIPEVGKRYVWLCTSVHAGDTGEVVATFTLTPLEDPPA